MKKDILKTIKEDDELLAVFIYSKGNQKEINGIIQFTPDESNDRGYYADIHIMPEDDDMLAMAKDIRDDEETIVLNDPRIPEVEIIMPLFTAIDAQLLHQSIRGVQTTCQNYLRKNKPPKPAYAS